MRENPPQPEDELSEMARSVVRGDADALARWFELESRQVYRLLLGLSADRALAEDLAADVLPKLLDQLPTWKGTSSYRWWRTALVTNAWRDQERRRAARKTAELRLTVACNIAEPLPDPSDAAQAAEVRALLVKALSGLPPREREVFVLRDLEGHAFESIAALLEISEGTVRSLLSLGRQRLRTFLGPRLQSLTAKSPHGKS